ncbi:unnamed protein product [Rhizophagus irregularis]|nr:unnamed protein product [Rhizophagus irregularis]CAB4417140.1 unnamed protein product [Rhizophagus irregularis]
MAMVEIFKVKANFFIRSSASLGNTLQVLRPLSHELRPLLHLYYSIAYISKFTSGYLLLILDVQPKQHSIIVGTALIIMLLIGKSEDF